jgi:hypothetical protein
MSSTALYHSFLDMYFMNVCISRAHKNEKAHQSRKENHSIVSGLLFSFFLYFLHSHWMNEREIKNLSEERQKKSWQISSFASDF